MDFKKDNLSASASHQNAGNQRHASNSAEFNGSSSLSYKNTQQESRASKGLSFVFRKSEKLTTALYMVTDTMNEREPMKWKMRETAVELLSGVTLSMNVTPAEKMSALADVLKRTDRLVSFLEIAEASRLLSSMNASVLKKEYRILKAAIEYEWTKIFDQDKMVFTDKFFDVPEDRHIEEESKQNTPILEASQAHLPQTSHREQQVPSNDKRHEKREVVTVSRETGGRVLVPLKKDIAIDVKKVEPKKVEVPRHEPMSVHKERMHGVLNVGEVFTRVERKSDGSSIERNIPDATKNDRRTIILALIKQKPALGVKDFTKSIPAVSEKTIQRELLAMVAEGLLVKRGERRWSTYSLPGQIT